MITKFDLLALNDSSKLLCKVFISKMTAMNNNVLKCRLLKSLKESLHLLILTSASNVLLIEMLEDWGLKACQTLTETLLNNFIFYSSHSSASSVIIKLIELLITYVSS
jgi:hypothetical protein